MEAFYRIFTMIAVSWFSAEAIKILIDYLSLKELEFRKFFRYGGMPSSHSAFVTSICTSIAIVEGFTTSFLLSLAIWILVIRDLMVIRGHIDSNTENIAKLSKNKLKSSLISHNLYQMAVGIMLGVIIPSALSQFM